MMVTMWLRDITSVILIWRVVRVVVSYFTIHEYYYVKAYTLHLEDVFLNHIRLSCSWSMDP